MENQLPKGTVAVGRYYILPRGKWLVFATLFIAVITALFLQVRAAQAEGPQASVPVESYLVQEGDSLWGIASTIKAPGEDVRDLIIEIRDLNGLSTGNISAGSEIVLPIRG